MKERLILKPWVKRLLFITQLLLFILIVCEFKTISQELVVKIPTMMIMLFNHNLLEKETDFFEKGF